MKNKRKPRIHDLPSVLVTWLCFTVCVMTVIANTVILKNPPGILSILIMSALLIIALGATNAALVSSGRYSLIADIWERLCRYFKKRPEGEENTAKQGKPMNKYKQLLSNTAILGIGTFGSKLLVFLLMPLYTEYLTTAEYGTADIITQTANLMIPLISMGICEAVFRFALDTSKRPEATFTTGLAVIGTGAAIFAVASPLLSKISYFGEYTALIFAYVIASSFHSLCAQFVRARGKTALFALQGIFSTVVTIVLNIVFLVAFDMSVIGYVLSVVLADVASSIYVIFAARLWEMVSPSNLTKPYAKEMLRFSVPLIPTTVFWWITNAVDHYMVRDMLGADINGLYAVAYKIPTLLILTSGVFIEAWQFSAVTERKSEDHSAFFGKVFDSFQAIMFMVGSGLVAFAKIFTMILTKQSYYDSWQYIPILVAATVFSSLVTFMGSVYLVEKKSVLSLVTAFVGAAVNVILNLLLIPVWGANGAAIATFMSYFIVFIIRAINARMYIKFDLHTPKLALNTLIILLQSGAMVLEITGWIFVQIFSIILIVAFNGKPILEGVLKVVERRLPRKRS